LGRTNDDVDCIYLGRTNDAVDCIYLGRTNDDVEFIHLVNITAYQEDKITMNFCFTIKQTLSHD